MNRLKFKAWDLVNSRMCEVNTLYLRDDFCVDISWVENGEPVSRCVQNGDDLILLQSTGLFDKNGKEVYAELSNEVISEFTPKK